MYNLILCILRSLYLHVTSPHPGSPQNLAGDPLFRESSSESRGGCLCGVSTSRLLNSSPLAFPLGLCLSSYLSNIFPSFLEYLSRYTLWWSLVMSVRASYSLPRLARLHTPGLRRWPSATSSAQSTRAFSTTLHRDATWGFVGLGQMGMYEGGNNSWLLFTHEGSLD